ncbi:MAG: hypothetical protein RRA92_07790 [Gemmatimonadota bacterium]|nr:hypothetical protein [Gemmatimonadota bacterium]
MKLLLVALLVLQAGATARAQETDPSGLVVAIVEASLERGHPMDPKTDSTLLIDLESFATNLSDATGRARSVEAIGTYVSASRRAYRRVADPVECGRTEPPCFMRHPGVHVALRKLVQDRGEWLATVQITFASKWESGVATEVVRFRLAQRPGGWSVTATEVLLQS